MDNNTMPKNWQDETEILLADGKILTKYKSVVATRILYQDDPWKEKNNRLSLKRMKKAYHMYSDGRIGDCVYKKTHSKVFGHTWINVYPLNWSSGNGMYYNLEDGKIDRIRGLNTEHNVAIDQDVINILFDTIKNLYKFNVKYKTDFYSEDIEELRDFVPSKHQLEILDMDLVKIK